jgi:hypothetical protein
LRRDLQPGFPKPSNDLYDIFHLFLVPYIKKP